MGAHIRVILLMDRNAVRVRLDGGMGLLGIRAPTKRISSVGLGTIGVRMG